MPELSLVLLVGASGSGKSTFAARHFKPTEVLSSDACRALVADDQNDQAATPDAFDVLHYVAGKRLAGGRLTVVDATNVEPEARRSLVRLAREHHVLPVAIVFDLPERVCVERNAARPDRDLPARVIRRQRAVLRRSLGSLQREGIRRVFVLRSPEDAEQAVVERERSWSDRRDERGPFDLIGDVHGCVGELAALLAKLGYELAAGPGGAATGASHPHGRRAVFLGDLVDRGPDTPGVLRLVMGMVAAGDALCVPGNHESKLLRALQGRDVQKTHGLAESLAQLEAEPPEFVEQVKAFLDGLVSHLVLDGGSLVAAHAGMRAEMQGRASAAVRSFALYGETTGETDEYGLPVRYPWADDYRGRALVAYGHTPVPEARFHNNTICLDTGCVFGGRLTALRWPERELVDVPAARTWYEPVRPLLPPGVADPGDPRAVAPEPAWRASSSPASGASGSPVSRASGSVASRASGSPASGASGGPAWRASGSVSAGPLLRLGDVLGKRIVTTRLISSVTVREEHARAALEVMSRFAADPRWLVYLPPTMAPTATSQAPGLLEHPAEAFAAYRHDGVAKVVCEEKHMGSRAVVVCCRDPEAARRRFGVAGLRALQASGPPALQPDGPPALQAEWDRAGIVHTRTGRPFFADQALEAALLERVRAALAASGLWDELSTDWVCLDAELMPWSVKAEELLRRQYAAVGAAATAGLAASVEALEATADRLATAPRDGPAAERRASAPRDGPPGPVAGPEAEAVARGAAPNMDQVAQEEPQQALDRRDCSVQARLSSSGRV